MKFALLFAVVLTVAACGTQDIDSPIDSTKPDTMRLEPLLLPLPSDTTADITASDLAQRIKTLADDTFEGRGPGTVAGEASATWIAAEMERIGLEPAGENGGWFQMVKMVNQTVDPVQSSLTFTLPRGRLLETTYKSDAVIWTKHQHTNEISYDASDVVFVGYGSVAPEYGWNDYGDLDYTGKTVVMLVNDPGYATRDPDLFKGKAMTYYGRWTYKFEEAARQGATAAIIVHETEPASYGWDVVANSWSGAQSDLVRANGGQDRALLEAWISRALAEKLFASAGLSFAKLKAEAKKPGFEPVPLTGVSSHGAIIQSIDRLESRNVLGKLTGIKSPDDFVLYTAHWDHLGKKSEKKTGARTEDFYRDQIFNGAVDNATGTAAILEIGEAMAQHPLDRSVLFAAVTLEESGLLGSAYYAENPTIPLNKIVAGMNIDAALPIGRTKNMVVVGHGASELEDILAEVLKGYDRVITPDTKPEAGYFYRSDHVSFAKKGVPMLYADGGDDVREGGVARGKAAAAIYSAERYHKPMDEYSSNWDLSGFEEDTKALHEVGLRIIQSSDWPTWYPGNEFESVRRSSLAEK